MVNLIRVKVTENLSDHWVPAEGWADEAARTRIRKNDNLQDMRIASGWRITSIGWCHGHFLTFSHRRGRAGEVRGGAEIDFSGGYRLILFQMARSVSTGVYSRRRSETGPIFAGPVGELRPLLSSPA